jgi:tRNA-dihydrouridine synthase B
MKVEKISKIMLKHLDNLYTFYGEYLGVRIARKHIGWYSRTQPDSSAFRKTINQAETPEQQQALIQAYFDQLISTRGRAA